MRSLNNREIVGYFVIGYTALSRVALGIRKEMMEKKRINRVVGDLKAWPSLGL
ncbi:MAG: hypothetical protein JRJ70_14855 [Deltaproteobacteria bacterium]|nr:hypothetical protein [Deltaproteobacteria bacterium]